MLLKGKKGIIFGALDQKSIAWKVAEESKKQGAEFVLTNAPIAMRMGEINDLADKIKFYSKKDKIRTKIARNGKKKYFKLFNETKITKYFIDISLGNKASLF